MSSSSIVRPTRLVRYRVTHAYTHGRCEAKVIAWASENHVLDGWDMCGVGWHRDPREAESLAVRNLQRTMADNRIFAACVPCRE